MIDTAALSLPLTSEREFFTEFFVPCPAAVDAARLVEPGELEPYRTLLADYLGRHERSLDIDVVIANPDHWNFTVPRFFRWLTVIHPDRLTVPQGNTTLPEGEPMTETTAFHVGDRVRYVEHEENRLVVGEEREVSEVREREVDLVFSAADRRARSFANGHVGLDRLALVSCPHAELVAGGFHVGDVVERTGVSVTRAVVTACPEQYREWGADGAHYWGISEGNVSPTFTYERPTLVSCPHQPLDAPQPTVPQGNEETTAPVPQGNDGSEWGPDHPEWNGWWAKARELAERFGYASQYDALAEQLGGPARISYDTVTVTITFPIETDQPVSHHAIRAALDEHGFAVTDRHPR